MIKENKTPADWLDIAVSGIRFRPDRAEVRQELEGHIEDKTADLKRLYPDLSPEEAQGLALGRMGDPEKIGRELAKIHRPWMGYLWRASQCLLVGVLTALAVLIVVNVKDVWTAWDLAGSPNLLELAEEQLQGRRAVAQLSESERVKIGDFTASIPRGVLWELEEGGQELYLAVRLSSLYFWEKAWPEKEGITLTDSLGNRYELTWEEHGDGTRSHDYSQARTGLFHTDCILRLRDFDRDARWVRLDYENLGQGFTLTAWLEEVEPDEP